MTTRKRIRFACETSVKSINLKNILPLHRITPGTRRTRKYQRIVSSIKEVGIIEPLIVHPQEKSNQYMLLDGHIRYDILKETGDDSVDCLIALDDEAFTYNHKVSRLTPIQEHFMLMKAVQNGVSEEAIASALNIDVAKIREKKNLLNGICPEAVELLKGKDANAGTFRQLRKAKPMRQIEMAELMCAANNFSVGYLKCLIAATPQEQLLNSEQSKDSTGLSPGDIARMEREMESIGKDFKQLEETHGKNVLNLVVVAAYIKKLLENARVVKFLANNHAEYLTEFQSLVESKYLKDTTEE